MKCVVVSLCLYSRALLTYSGCHLQDPGLFFTSTAFWRNRFPRRSLLDSRDEAFLVVHFFGPASVITERTCHSRRDGT
jgi:hypothetical protein